MKVSAKFGPAILLAMAACSSEPANVDKRAAPPAFAGIPNVEIEHYEVSGGSAQAIRASIDRHPRRPRDPNDGRPMDAVARWFVRWTWPGYGESGCDLRGAELQFNARVVMPRLADEASVPAPVRERWRAYMVALQAHEDNHIRYAYESRNTILAAIRSSSCEGAEDAAQRATAAISRHDVDYDRRTGHGSNEGVSFP